MKLNIALHVSILLLYAVTAGAAPSNDIEIGALYVGDASNILESPDSIRELLVTGRFSIAPRPLCTLQANGLCLHPALSAGEIRDRYLLASKTQEAENWIDLDEFLQLALNPNEQHLVQVLSTSKKMDEYFHVAEANWKIELLRSALLWVNAKMKNELRPWRFVLKDEFKTLKERHAQTIPYLSPQIVDWLVNIIKRNQGGLARQALGVLALLSSTDCEQWGSDYRNTKDIIAGAEPGITLDFFKKACGEANQ